MDGARASSSQGKRALLILARYSLLRIYLLLVSSWRDLLSRALCESHSVRWVMEDWGRRKAAFSSWVIRAMQG